MVLQHHFVIYLHNVLVLGHILRKLLGWVAHTKLGRNSATYQFR